MNRRVAGGKLARNRKTYGKLWRLLPKVAMGLCLIFSIWLVFTTITIISASSQSIDAFFVLGGSIVREIHVAKLAKQHPSTPILISQGSPDPCIWKIFHREATQMQQVWLEKCADSTFGNFYYSLPILQGWKVRKVKLITSATHLPRAKWMAQIILGSHGMWVEIEVVREQGIPGNREYGWKTGLDVTRSLLWGILSQVIQPKCSQVTKLVDVDMEAWQRRGFKCEHQGGLGMINEEW